MRLAAAAPPLVAVLLLGACSSGSPAGTAGTPAPTASAAATGLTQDACRVLTAADVQGALGVPVTQLPLTSPPPGGGPGGGNLVSGCTYSSSAAAAGGASLYLYRDMAIDYFATVPGFTPVPGVGDAAYEHVPMLIGRKGQVTFQLTIDSSAAPAKADAELRMLAHAAAARL